MPSPRRALVLIDVQQEYFDGPLAIQYPPRDDALAAITRAVDAAHDAGIPVVAVQHTAPAGYPVFDPATPLWRLHDDIESRRRPDWLSSQKSVASILNDADLVAKLRDAGVDTLTFAGFMTNNCVFASAAAAEPLGLAVEVLSDATGAIHISNEAGTVTAEQVHRTLMVLLNSNFAAVAPVDTWAGAVSAGTALPKSNLVQSATAGAQAAAG